MKTIDKVLELRKSIKSTEPQRTFTNRMKSPREILNIVEYNAKSTRDKYEVRRYYCTSLTAAFEMYWRDFFIRIINSGKLTPQATKHLSKVTFSFQDIYQIVGKNLSFGELVACAFVFQSPSAVNQCASEILGIDAFGAFSKTKYSLKEVRRKNSSPKSPPAETIIDGRFALKQIPIIEECIAIRHETVHSSGTRFRLSMKKLLRYDSAIFQFNSLFGMFVHNRAVDLWMNTKQVNNQ